MDQSTDCIEYWEYGCSDTSIWEKKPCFKWLEIEVWIKVAVLKDPVCRIPCFESQGKYYQAILPLVCRAEYVEGHAS